MILSDEYTQATIETQVKWEEEKALTDLASNYKQSVHEMHCEVVYIDKEMKMENKKAVHQHGKSTTGQPVHGGYLNAVLLVVVVVVLVVVVVMYLRIIGS